MTINGQLIYFSQDPFGELRVFDDGSVRTLSFAAGNEQSACIKANPGLLVFEYTQVMLLGLLFAEPRKVLCLGLGAGSLATAVHRHCKNSKITAVELRQAVIDVAENYFYLPTGKRLQVHCQDAGVFVVEDTTSYDLIFSDIYTAFGVAPLQLQADFLAACAARLKPEGVLVINCWREHENNSELIHVLSGLFTDIRVCATGDGNWVIFAARWLLESRPKVLREAAEAWSTKLGFSLVRHLKQLTPA